MKNNQNSATEDTLGFLHSAVTRGFLAKMQVSLEQFDAAKALYDQALLDEDPDAMAAAESQMMMSLDERTLTAAGKWVLANEITYATPEDNGASPLKSQLDAIKERQKSKTIPFKQVNS